MKNRWLLILCIAMGLLMVIGLCFIGVGLQRENTPQKRLQREMQKNNDGESELALLTLSEGNHVGEATHV